jgi:hypothetical protein
MKQLKSIIVLLVLALVFAFSASATETYRGSNNGNEKRVTQKITGNGNHHSGTHHNNSSNKPQ